MKGKKAISVWVSYVLLTALVVSLSFFVLRWSQGLTEDTVEDIVARGDALVICGKTGIDISNLCQNTQTLNMNVTNSNDVKVISVQARMFDIYNMPQTFSRNATIEPHKTKEVSILKQGIIKKAEIIPVVKNDKVNIICLSRKVDFEDIPVCL